MPQRGQNAARAGVAETLHECPPKTFDSIDPKLASGIPHYPPIKRFTFSMKRSQ
jgi:hypothetical protein